MTLHVITMRTGDKYSSDYVDKLERAVSRNLSLPYTFECIRETKRPGWWGKVELFERYSGDGFLWLDLDVVITGPLDDLCNTDADIRVGMNTAKANPNGCQSSVMFWKDCEPISALFTDGMMEELKGDQDWITYLRDTDVIEVDYFNPAHVVSYKHKCLNGLPEDARVVNFHGKPDPHEVQDQWVRDNWL